jgi:hypothetical protein
MSIEATVWALKHAPVPDAIAHLVLIGLADHAAADGTCAWPSVTTLAGYARCSERSVQRKLRDLEALGVILQGNQQIVNHLRPDRRPTVWDLPIHGVTERHPAQRGDRTGTDGVTDRAERGDTEGANGVTLLSPEPYINHPEPSEGTVQPAGPADRFQEFWDAYGKKKSRGQAITAWKRALKKAEAEVIIAAALAHAEWHVKAGTEAQFIPHPATWLNGERWADERPEAASGKASTTDARVAEGVALAERLAAEPTEPLRAIGGYR